MLKSQFPFIQWFSEMLTDTDISMKYNILYTRVCPIPIVDNDIEEKSPLELFKELYELQNNQEVSEEQEKYLMDIFESIG